MPRKAAVDQSIYLDEAEGFILEHALFSPPRTWPPLPVDHAAQAQAKKLRASRKKMDWEEEVRNHPDEPFELPLRKNKNKDKQRMEGVEHDDDLAENSDDDANKERCVICLMALRDPTIVGTCGHEFCFECIGVWANQSRRCPLCSADMAPFLLHDLDASTPTKFYLPPLPTHNLPFSSLPGPSRNRLREQEWARERERQRLEEVGEKAELDELDLQVARRREIYQHELYAKATDIRSEPAIQLLQDILPSQSQTQTQQQTEPQTTDYPRAAEHFAHEVYSFLRSPFKELRKYDDLAQYDPVPVPRSRSASPVSSRSRSRSRSLSHSPSRSQSRSPSPYSARLSSRSPSRSRSRSRSPKRKWSQRDTFVAPPSPDARRWDEHDTWLDPEYAAWLKEENRREAEREDRKRARRQRPSKVVEVLVEEKSRVELLPSPSPPPLRMEEPSTNGGLSIRGAAKSVEPLPTVKLTLLERLAKAKAEAATNAQASIPSSGNGGTQPALSATAATLRERLAKAKAEAAARATSTAAGTNGNSSTATLSPATVESIGDTQPAVITPSSEVASTNRGLKEMIRARLRLRLKLENERAKNASLTHAQALRQHLLAQRAWREAEQVEQNYGGMDHVLRQMDAEERKREVRRRLMVLRVLEAETENERRSREERELKAKLMAKRAAAAVGAGSRAVVAAVA